MLASPKVDERTAEDVCRAVRMLLPKYVKGWPEDGMPAGATEALIGIFGHFCELIINRLNQTPEKNLLAFLDLLGASPLPPQPARVPMTFFLAGQAAVDAFVPALTQIAAPPAQGEQEPKIFETQAALTVTSARLDSLFSKDVSTDRYADYSSTLEHPGSAGVEPFSGNLPVDHALYIGLDLFSHLTSLKRLTLSFVLEQRGTELLEPGSLLWEIWDGRGIPLKPVLEAIETAAVISGEVMFTNLPAFPPITVEGQTTGWLRCRCLTPIIKGPSRNAGTVSAAQLPVVKSLTVRTEAGREGLLPERAFSNVRPLDVTKDFLPFGEKPRLADTLCLSCPEAFSAAGARVILHVKLSPVPEAAVEEGIPTVRPLAPKVRWECWNGQEWKILGDSERIGRVRVVAEGQQARPEEFSDTTGAFTADGDISFTLIEAVPPSSVNGQKGCWIRARMLSGSYGEEARIEHDPARGYVFVPATFSPPSINSLRIDYSVETTSIPNSLVKFNDFSNTKVPPGEPFRLFEPIKEEDSSLYLGFAVPPGQTLSGRPLTLYFGASGSPPSVPSRATRENALALSPDPLSLSRLRERGDSAKGGVGKGRARVEASSSVPGSLGWEYWNSQKWAPLTVRDNTSAFAHSGLVRFVGPGDVAMSEEFGRLRYWVRINKEDDAMERPPLRCVLLNTTLATQALTMSNEILGSSTGKPNQAFQTVRHPILAGQQLHVRESSMPSEEEQRRIQRVEGEDAIIRTSGPGAEEPWIRWREVPDLYASGPQDRHYILDRGTGEVRFGNGVNGLIPPALPKNIRMQHYQTGGGPTGNKPAHAITQMRTSVPYVERAVNFEVADGGADAENMVDLMDRVPRAIRHGGRAVTTEDFEDLARLASREVARAKCVPLCDLGQEPDAKLRQPGVVSLIIVPFSPDTKPQPSTQLMECIRSFLEHRRLSTVELVLVGPDYVRIDVSAEVGLATFEDAGEVTAAVREALTSFLNPLTGGPDGAGWEFGRLPKESDLYGLIHRVKGVDHVRTLALTRTGDRPGTESTGRFLIYPGDCRVLLV